MLIDSFWCLSGGYFFCDKCHRAYKWKKNMRQHQKLECGKEPQFVCPFEGCNYKAKVKVNMKQHLSSKKHKAEIY